MLKPALALATAIVTALAASAAGAIEYTQVHADKSAISFAYQQMGVKMDGRFRRFSAQVSFDPANPAAARATLDVDLASVDTGSSEADQEVAGKPWFNIKDFPSARFISGSVKTLGGNRYEVAGKLTMKGRTVDVTVPATFTAQGNSAAFDGAFTIRRSDFAIGDGSWAKFDVVANDVQIRFRLTASAK
jgi:polyisoprenoid-binding protein YceI